MATKGGLGPVPISADWYIDPVNGDDRQTGRDGSNAFKTLGKLLSLVAPNGTWEIFTDTTVHWRGDTIADTDINALIVRLYNSANLFLMGDVSQVVKGNSTFTGVTTRNTATNTPWLLNDAATANFAPYVHLILEDRTTVTKSWISAAPAANQCRSTEIVSPTQLLTFGTLPLVTAPIVGDTYRVLSPAKVNISSITIFGEGCSTQVYAGVTNQANGSIFAYNLWFVDKNGGNSSFEIISPPSAQASFQQCRFDASVQIDTGEPVFTNCMLVNGLTSAAATLVLGGEIASFVQDLKNMNIDGNALLTGSAVFLSLIASLGNVGLFGSSVSVGATGQGIGVAECLELYAGTGHALWGGGGSAIDIAIGSHLSFDGTAVAAFPVTAGFTLNGAAVGEYHSRVTGVTTGNIATTWANVDLSPAGNIAVIDIPNACGVHKRQ